MTYEENMKKLDDIVSRMESGSVDLDESIALYEEGIRTAKGCLDGLETAKGKIKLLQRDLNKLIEKDFDIDEL